MSEITVLINPISSPIQIGVYENGLIVKKLELSGQTSEVLLKELEAVFEQYDVDRIIYANGPGSYMAIKLTYIMLKTIEMIRKIPFYGVSAFELNGSKPIKAMGKLYFTKEKETIMTQKFDEKFKQEFWLPDDIGSLYIEEDNRPLYLLPAV